MYSNKYCNNPEKKVLLTFVRNEPVGPLLDACDPDALAGLAVGQKILSPLAHGICSEAGAPARWRRWAAMVSMSAERDAKLCSTALSRTVAFLEAGGVSPVVLKGPSLALGKPRDMGDVDLLIPGEALLDSIALLEARGYRYRGFDRNMYIRSNEFRDWKRLARWANQFEFTEPETGALIELHTALFERGRVYSEDLSALHGALGELVDSSARDAADGYRYFALEDRALLLALHAGLKRSPEHQSFILRHVTDLRALAEAGLDWEALRRRAGRIGMTHHLLFLARVYESIVGPRLPAGYAEALESGVSPRTAWLVGVHVRCLRGIDDYDRASIFVYQLLSPFILRGTARARMRSLLVVPLLLPPVYALERLYGLPQRSRLGFLLYFLEPFRLLLRIIRKAARVAAGLSRRPGTV